jgi:hypothetical protein
MKNKKEMLEFIFKDHKNPKIYSIKLFDISILSFYYNKRFGWIRLFGVGIKWQDVLIHRLTFSEMYKFTKYLKLGNWTIGYLPKSKIY